MSVSLKDMQKVVSKKTAMSNRPFKHVDVVEVYLWQTHIGSIALDPAYGFYRFGA
jgi:serine/threonine-protein kinase HipA